MIEKIKQNPKRFLGIVAGVFFIAAILFMLLPGIYLTANDNTIYVSLFGLIFGGAIKGEVGDVPSDVTIKAATNPLNLISFILLIIAIVGIVVLLIGLFKEKFNKKTIIILASIILVLVVVSAILTFACKTLAAESIARGEINSMVEYMKQQGVNPPAEEIEREYEEVLKFLKSSEAVWKLGPGAIVSPIMMLLGAGSLTGVICLSAKEAK